MTRKSSGDNKNKAKSPEKKIAQLVEDLVFRPTYEQVQVKAAFWAKFSANPLVDVNNITLAHVQRFVNDPRLGRWWTHNGFKEWFCNEEEFAQRALAIAHLALGALEDILTNPDANASARVNAAKLAVEVANKMPQKWQKTVYLDDQVHKMDRAQLESFLRQKGMSQLPEGLEDNEEKNQKDTGEDSSN